MSDLSDRDYSEEFSVTMSWSDWNHLYELVWAGMRRREEQDGWPEEEIENSKELRKRFNSAIAENSPGNGMEDWSESLQQAYDETVMEMIEDMD